MYDFLFDFCCHHLSILYRFRDIRLQIFKVWPWPLTPKGHLGSKTFILFERPYMTPYSTSMDNILYLVPFSRYSTSKFSGFDLDLWPLKVIWGQQKFYHSKGHISLPIRLLWAPSLYLVPFSRYSTSKFLGFDLDLWPLKVIWGQKFLYHLKAHTLKAHTYSSSYSTSIDNISVSRTVFEKFDFNVFRVWPWPLTPKGHSGLKKNYTIRKPIYDSLFYFYGQHLSILYKAAPKPAISVVKSL